MQGLVPVYELSRRVHVAVPGEPVQTFTARLVLHQAPLPEISGQELVRASLIGWGDDLVDQDGKPIAYSEAARDRLLALPFVLSAVAAAVRQAVEETRLRAAVLRNALAAEPMPEVH